ncbi:dihydroneopterin aldolase [Flavobacteriaceae bacterium]|jgi:7,8-dihydroneopterin aldolase/epimerase/oxygenase|nr:dihydroneopterin aldolase [Flavobacteriaceae bacterium]
MVEIYLKNVRCYCFHGCLKEESIIGSEYLVNLWAKGALGKASLTDKIDDAIDYVFLNKVVVEEMSIPSKLLETVAERILNRVLNEDNKIQKITVSVSKICPPINGDVESVAVKLSKKRENKI